MIRFPSSTSTSRIPTIPPASRTVRILLDTSTLLWAAQGDPRLSDAADAIIGDRAQELLFSAVSAMEIAMKHAAGRLVLPESPARGSGPARRCSGSIELPDHG